MLYFLEESVAKRYAFCVLLFVFSLTSLTFAQTANTALRGSIKDPSGAVVPGAKITLTDNTSGKVLETTSNASGDYQFNQIPPAKYNIKVSVSGFGDQQKFAELLVNQPSTIDFALTVQASSEIVNVSASAQTLNTTDASLGNAMNDATIQALPSLTRNVPDLLSLQPGVLYFQNQDNGRGDGINDSRSGAVNGGRSDQGNITLDGVDDNDQVFGYAFTGVLRQTQDSIEEFRVTTGSANADAGRSSGAQVSMVTKSGTNKFHGSVYEYHRPTFTVANDWFNKQAELNSGLPNIPGKVLRNIFGGAVGGPILKDKLFFFGTYEGQRQAENQQVTRTAPTASYQQGNLIYEGDNADGSTSLVTLTPSQIATLDAPCTANGVCPWGPGPNPNALSYLQQFPAANGTALGDGYNSGSYSFSSPHPQTLNTSIGRIDYILGQKHRIFVRGNLQKDTISGAEQFPGQPASTSLIDNSKGITAGDTWTITPNIVNDVRYGYVRQGTSNRGIGQGDYVDFRFLDTPTAETRTTITSVPVNNIVDNLSWAKGKHNISVGGNWRLVDQNRSSDLNSFNSASSNPYWLGGNPPDPSDIGALPVDGGFSNSYLIAYANIVGTVPSVTNVYNYQITSPTSGSLLSDGDFITRHYRANEFEYYLQDSWRVMPNLTLTFGIRHTILQTPYETSGQQVAPTIDTHTWFYQRQIAASQGQVYEPDLTFSPTGKTYGKPAFWPKSKDNIAPRFAFAYSPDTKTSIRGGFGIYYDHYGQGLVNTFDQNGSFGVSSSLTNPAGVYKVETAPRFTGRQNFPPISNGPAPATASFPYTPPEGLFQITWGLDSKIKTPYSESIDFSVQRELPKGFTFEAAYVGRMGRHLLQQLDIGEPVNYSDPLGGGDYFTNGATLSRLVDQNGGNSLYSGSGEFVNVPAIKYFEDVFPYMAGYDFPGESATAAIYNNEWAPYRSNLGATSALSDIDFYCYYISDAQCSSGPNQHNLNSKFWQNQFSSLYALASMGSSYYNAGQFSLHHPSSHGLQMDFSYTLAKSIDMGSDAERSSEFSKQGAFSSIYNTWKPELNRGVSDFDTRHLITADWVYQLPFGRGNHFLGSVNGATDAVIGGWQLSGIVRWTSGLPFSLFEPGWSTNWQQESNAVVTGKVKMRRHFDANGNPQFFDDPDAINSGTLTGSPVRLPYPGEAGERNNFRGDGLADLDSGLAKTWRLGEYGGLKFAWEVYNVTNTVRFDPGYIGEGLTSGNLGIASSLLSQGRRMQFSLRYDF
jgi:Carboxypeptidase regulatory-like domain